MNDDQLERLLHQTAERDAAPELPADLAGRVRRRLARRQRHRRIVSSSAVVSLLIAAAAVWHVASQAMGTANLADQNARPPGATGVSPVPATSKGATGVSPVPASSGKAKDSEVTALRAQLTQLQEEFTRLEARIKADAARRQFQRRLAALRRELRKPDPGDLAMAEIEKTAFLLVHRAQACEKQKRDDDARQQYQQVVKLFPNTSWAKVAQERLNK